MSDTERARDEDWTRRPTSAAALAPGSGWTDGWAAGAGVRLHYVTTGDGPLVVLLHGFPDFWLTWRRQIPALRAAGYRVVAVDLRGYNLSERPRRVEDYRLDLLADDVASLVRALGASRAHVVGHDWGGAIAWHLAARHAQLVDRLVILNAPHPGRYRRLLATPAQAARAWYVAFFQLPLVPERLLIAGDLAALRRIWRSQERVTAPGEEEAFAAAFRDPAAVWAALAYYRAVARHGAGVPPEQRRLRSRTLVLWGERDPALVRENADGLAEWVPQVEVRLLPEAGHWVMADAPEAVNRALIEFLDAP
jgi:pimeloyl-ACP methyl ester carboxylesterase